MAGESTSALTPTQLARLLAIGTRKNADPRPGDPAPTTADALRALLAGEPSLDAEDPDSVPAVLQRPCDELRSAAGRNIETLILDPATELDTVRTLKDYAKALARHEGPPARHAAATALYYAAIASAMLFRGQRITQLSYGRLRQAFADLAAKEWMPVELKDLLAEARSACETAEMNTRPLDEP